MLTGPEPGITRDAIAIKWHWGGRPIRLIDTAGMRRRARIEARLERLSVADTLRAVRFAETVILVLDAEAAAGAPGPDDREPGGRGRPGARAGAQQMRPRRRSRGTAEGAARAARNRLAAAFRGGAGAGVGSDRVRSRRADEGGIRGRRGMEPPRSDRGAEPLAGWMQERHPPPLVAGRRCGCAT